MRIRYGLAAAASVAVLGIAVATPASAALLYGYNYTTNGGTVRSGDFRLPSSGSDAISGWVGDGSCNKNFTVRLRTNIGWSKDRTIQSLSGRACNGQVSWNHGDVKEDYYSVHLDTNYGRSGLSANMAAHQK
ncbi:hypothetical protein ACH4U6_01535 [Streptomyces netropsis]|uniref:hypothetical protein n=1 Tax=Streptomyces netropsis TaxID=55404 RepID=UPI00379FE5B3